MDETILGEKIRPKRQPWRRPTLKNEWSKHELAKQTEMESKETWRKPKEPRKSTEATVTKVNVVWDN
jgi:hypothetical protein